MTSRTTIYQREKLYDEVWAEPVDLVAKRYSVSGVALAKVCRKLGVPLPARGYWARKRAGQKLRVPKLPPLAAGARAEIHVTRWERPPRPPLAPEMEAKVAEVRATSAAISVAATLDSPHKLVVMSAKLLRKAKPSQSIVSCRDDRCLDISVSPMALNRALCIMDALLRTFEKLKLRVEVTEARPHDWQRAHRSYDGAMDDEPSNATRVNVSGEWVRFGISERSFYKYPPAPPTPKHLRGFEAKSWERMHRAPGELVPSGELILAIFGLEHLSLPKTWRDGKRRKVEDCLNEFVANLFITAEAITADRAEQERQRIAREEEQRRGWEEQRRREEEERTQKSFQEVLGRWRLAHDIQGYVAETRRLVEDARLDITPGGGLDRHLKWALAYAERIDPLRDLRADIATTVAERDAMRDHHRGETAISPPEPAHDGDHVSGGEVSDGVPSTAETPKT